MSSANDFVIENGVLKKYKGPGGDVVIPKGVTSIGDDAFSRCKKLTSIMIPDSVTRIGDGAFSNCTSLTSVTIPEGVTRIDESAFHNCRALTSVTIPESVTRIDYQSFCFCVSLTSVTIPDSVTRINERAFYDCHSLTSVTIPDGVTHIGPSAFGGCSSLTNVTIPDSVTRIGYGAFSDCDKAVFYISSEAANRKANFIIEDGILIQYQGIGGDVVIPEGVTRIGYAAFLGCSALTSVTIPESVTCIGDEAFRGCTGLKKLIVSPKLESLGKDPFGRVGTDTFGCVGTAMFERGGKLPAGLIGELGSFCHALTDRALKTYVLVPDIWKQIPVPLRTEIYLSRQGKILTESYCKCMDEDAAGQICAWLLERLNGKASAKDCGTAETFLTTLYEKVPAERLKAMYARLKAEKNGAKALKAVKEHVTLMEKLGGEITVDESLAPTEKLVMESLIADKMSAKDLEQKLQAFYSLQYKDLPELKTAEGSAVAPFVPAWLLTAHETLKEHHSRSGSDLADVVAGYDKPGIREEASEIIAQLGQGIWQNILLKLADNCLGIKGRSKKMFMAYPICRYADEETMAELTRRAPKWRSSVSGNDAPSLAVFRKACLYSDTRAAMLFAERYHELYEYAKLRGMTEDELRDKYLSDVGLDEQGGKVYDLGSQTVTARLQRDLGFIFELPGGKTAKSLPKKGADPAKYEAAKADFDEMRKAVKKILKSRGNVLFEDFLSGRSRKSSEWREAYVNNPLLRIAAGLLVWSQGEKTFTLTDANPIDSAGQVYAFTDKPIKLAHPMEMQPEDVAAWQKYFNARGLKQPFAQVWEPVVDPKSVAEDRYVGCMIPYYRFTGQAKHGITVEDYDFHNEIIIRFAECYADVERIDWRRHEIRTEDRFEIESFKFKKYTRRVNHIVAYLDRITVLGHVKKDDITVISLLDGFTLAQITEFIAVAQESNATNVLAALLDYKNTHFTDFDPMDEFTLEW